MNSFVRYIVENGGKEYRLVYNQDVLKGQFSSCNTTCAWFNDELVINSRLVNYRKIFQSNNIRLIEDKNAQTYLYLKNGFDTKNVTSRFADGNLVDVKETIYSPPNLQNVYYHGLEDIRFVVWDGKLYSYGTRWDKVVDKGCICLHELDDNLTPINETIILPQSSNNCEKNWGAIDDKPFTFMYANNPTTVVKINKDGYCWLYKQHEKNEKFKDWIKGSSQIIRYDNNTYISLVHTNKHFNEGEISRTDYVTAFAFYDNDLNLIKLSDWFVFKNPMCEFTCGLAIHDNDVYITYSQLDCTSNLLVTNKEAIEMFMKLPNNSVKQYEFMDYYLLAKDYEDKLQYNTAYGLYNYAALLNSNPYPDLQEECLVKAFCGVLEQLPELRVNRYLWQVVNCLKNITNKHPNSCEFYYILSSAYKIAHDYDNYKFFKKLGDERKLNIHNYFFKYLNPNYL